MISIAFIDAKQKKAEMDDGIESHQIYFQKRKTIIDGLEKEIKIEAIKHYLSPRSPRYLAEHDEEEDRVNQRENFNSTGLESVGTNTKKQYDSNNYKSRNERKEENNENFEHQLQSFNIQAICYYEIIKSVSSFRENVRKLNKNQDFQMFFIFLIFGNCITLAMYDPLHPNSKKAELISTVELILNIAFTLEMILSMIENGIIGYLKRPWNCFDGSMVLAGYTDFMTLGSGGESSASSFKALRALRALRPLRTITRFQSLRSVIVCFLEAMPLLVSVIGLLFFFLFVFAIAGLLMFIDVYHYACYSPTMGIELAPGNSRDEMGCSANRACPEGYTCKLFENGTQHDVAGFDNILSSMLTVFQCTTLGGWSFVMYRVIDRTGWFSCIYFILLLFFGPYFVINLFLAVLKTKYGKVQAQLLNKIQASTADRKNALQKSLAWINSRYRKHVLKKLPSISHFNEKHKLPIFRLQSKINQMKRDGKESNYEVGSIMYYIENLHTKIKIKIHYLVLTDVFMNFFLFCIIINTALLAIEYDGMSKELEEALFIANLILTLLFTFEMLIKIFGLGFIQYISDKFNIFDAAVVCLALLELAYNRNGNAKSSLKSLRFLKCFRVLRLFKLFRYFRSLRQIGEVLISSASSFVAIVVLLFLFMLVFAILGLNVYGDLLSKKQFPNFTSFLQSFMLTFNVLTLEDWEIIMYSVVDNTNVFSVLFFVSWVVLGKYVFLTLFLAVILDAFETKFNSELKENNKLSDNDEKSANDDEIKNIELSLKQGEVKNKSGNKKGILITNKAKVTPFDDGEVSQNIISSQSRPSNDQGKHSNDLVLVDIDNEIPQTENYNVSEENALKSAKLNINELVMGLKTYECQAENIINKKIDFKIISENQNYIEEEKDKLNTELITTDLEYNNNNNNNEISKKNESIAELEGFSYYILSPHNKLRIYVNKIVEHDYFEYFMFFWVIINCISMALEGPNVKRNSLLGSFIYNGNIFFTILFGIEFIMKSIAITFKKYIKGASNMVDFIIVVFSVLELILLNIGVLSIKNIRIVRTLKPLRVLTRSPGMLLVFRSLALSLAAMANVSLLCLLFCIIFAILGVQLFSGRFSKCNDDSVEYEVQCTGTFIDPLTSVMIERKWITPIFNFNNIGNALLSLFVIVTLDGYNDILVNAISVTEKGQQPKLGSYNFGFFYVMAFILVCSFCLLNLYIGVVFYQFSRIRLLSQTGSAFLTQDQQEWSELSQMVFRLRPIIVPPKHKSPFRRWCYKMVVKKSFDFTMSFFIVINVAVMALEYYGKPKIIDDINSINNIIFTAIYALEAAIKIYSYTWTIYVKSGWNKFDLFLVAVSFLDLSISYILAVLNINGRFKFIQHAMGLLRIARVFKLVRKFKGVRSLLSTLIVSLPAFWNVGALLLLIFFVYAYSGVLIFGTVKRGKNLNEHANFESFFMAMLTLLRVATSDEWKGIMEDCMIEPPKCDYNLNNCGTKIAIFYFLTFVLIITFIMLNLFMAVIIENFDKQNDQDQWKVHPSALEEFVELWSQYDDGYTTITPKQLEMLLVRLSPPLGLGSSKTGSDVLRFAHDLDIPLTENGKVPFHRTAFELVKRCSKAPMPEGNTTSQIDKLFRKYFNGLQEDNPLNVSAAVMVPRLERRWRAKLYTKRMKKRLETRNERKILPSYESLCENQQKFIMDLRNINENECIWSLTVEGERIADENNNKIEWIKGNIDFFE